MLKGGDYLNIFEIFGSIGLKDEGFNKGIDEAMDKGESFGSKIGNMFANLGKAAAVGLGAAATAFSGLSVKALQLGGDLEQNLGGSEAVFAEFADTVQNVGAKAFETMGLAQSDFLATANKMGALFQGAGFEIEDSAIIATEAMQRAADVASIMGLDTSAAMEAIAGAAKGNFTMMDNLGVAMNDTAIQAYALSKGIQTSTADMTSQQKIGLAMEMFMEKTAYAAGNYAKENETLAGSLSTAQAALTNFLSGAGDADSVVSSVSNLVDVVATNLMELLPRLTTGLTTIAQGLLPKIPELFATLLPAVIEGASSLINGFIEILPQFVEVITDSLPEIVQAFLSMAPLLLQAGIEIIASLLEGIGQMLPELIPTAVETIMTLIQGLVDNLPLLIEAAFQLVEGLATGLIDAIPVLVDKLPEIINSIVEFLTDNLPKLIQAGVELLTSLIADMPTIIKTILEVLPDLINSLLDALLGNIPAIIEAGIQLLTSLVEALPEIISAIVEVLPKIIEAIVGSLVDAIPLIIEAGIKLLVSLVDALPTIINTIVEAIPRIIDSIINAVVNSIPLLVQAGIDLLIALVQALPKIITTIVEAIPKIVISIADAIIGNIDKIVSAGVELFIALIENLPVIIAEIVKAVPQIITGIANAFTQLAPKIVELGTNLIKGIWQGISDAGKWLHDKVSGFFGGVVDNIKDFFGIKSPSKLMATLGKYTVEGFAQGIEKNSEKAAKAAAKMAKDTYNNAKLWIEDYRNDTEYLVEGELKMWETLAEDYAKGTKERVEIDKNVNKLREQVDKEYYDNAKLMIQDYQNSVKYSISEEIAMWEALGETYTEVSKEKVEIDKTVAKLREQQHKEELEAQKKSNEESFNFSKIWIEAQKALFQLSTQEEIEAWQRVADRYEEGSKQKEEAEKNLSKLREDLRKAEIDAVSEMEKAEQAYLDKLNARAEAIFNTFSMFGEVNLQETNVEKNTEAAKKSQDAYDKAREELQKAKDAVSDFTGKIEDYAKKQADVVEAEKKVREAHQELTKATEDAAKTQAQVMSDNLAEQILTLEDWERNLKELADRGINEGLLAELQKMGPTATSYLKELNKSSDEELTELSELYQEKHELARKLATDELVELRKETNKKISDILLDLTKKMSSETNPIGVNMIQGIMGGIQSQSESLKETMRSLMQEVVNEANSVLDIHSPSKVFAKIGKFTGQGFIEGIKGIANKVGGAVSSVFGGFETGDINANLNVSRNIPALATASAGASSVSPVQRNLRPIEVHIHNTNVISNDMDIDKVSRKLSDKTIREIRAKGGTLK